MKYTIALLFVAVACNVQKNKSNDLKPAEANDTGQTVNFEYMDTTVDPRVDFYEYANGIWAKQNPVPASETRWGSFNELQINNYAALRTILEEAASGEYAKGTPEQLIGDYYYSYMDSNNRNKSGIQPIMPYLNSIDALKSKEDLTALIASFHNIGISCFVSAGVEQDLKKNNIHKVYISQSGTGLPGKTYYTKDDEESVALQADYREHISAMLEFTIKDMPEVENYVSGEAEAVYKIESRLADLSMTRTELRNYEALYNKFSAGSLFKMSSLFNWENYLELRGLADIDSVIVMQPEFVKGLDAVLQDFALNDLKAYLKWHVINTAASSLSDEIVKQDFAFYSTRLSGQQQMKPRWKDAIESFGRSGFSENLGHVFVKKYFSPEAKTRVNEMVDNIIVVYKDRIMSLDWMTDATKAKAIEKLAAFKRKLGYPDKWRDYSTLDITKESYAANVLAISKFAISENTDKLHKEVDRTKWGMAPHIINAYYSPLFNEIVFPAGIMQPPFFDLSKEDAVNYARMGAIIGHELTHGFDDQGALFSADGEFENWWGEEDKVQFSARTKKLVSQFDAFEALPGLKINGQLTLGENIADFGGLTIAYYAYQKSMEGKEPTIINGFTNNQRFFIAFAQIWKSNYTEGAMKLQVNTNPHSPGKWRVIGPLSNMPEFFEAFDIREGDPMRQPEDRIAVIW